MFIHWGVYSVPAGVWKGEQSKHIGEWLMLDYKIPVAEYAALTKQFNPVKFDADKIVRTAKDAGMKYIVITSKHHDGFAMFHSSASPYNIYDATPFKRDPLKELAAACKKRLPARQQKQKDLTTSQIISNDYRRSRSVYVRFPNISCRHLARLGRLGTRYARHCS